jgi:ferredoxin
MEENMKIRGLVKKLNSIFEVDPFVTSECGACASVCPNAAIINEPIGVTSQ